MLTTTSRFPAPTGFLNRKTRDGSSHSPAISTATCHDILIVEDDAALRGMLGHVLDHAGYRVHETVNGSAALEYLSQNQPKLIITDIFMPDSDGFELLTCLRSVQPRPEIIAMSGSMAGDLRLFLRMASHLGAKHTLMKPFPLKELLDAVADTIGSPRGERLAADERPDNPAGNH